jgi:predicted nucleic acid-binding protein
VRKSTVSLPDTNTIVRYLIRDNPEFYQRAKEFFDKVKSNEGKAVILESVLAECIYVLMKIYQVPRDQAAGRLIDILRYKGIVNKDKQDLIQALTLFAETRLDIVDSVLCAKAASSGAELFTFDEELARSAKR